MIFQAVLSPLSPRLSPPPIILSEGVLFQEVRIKEYVAKQLVNNGWLDVTSITN